MAIPAYVSGAEASSSTSSTSISVSYNPTGGTDKVLLIFVGWRNGGSPATAPSDVTWDGASIAGDLVINANTEKSPVAIYKVLNPTAGSKTAQATWAAAQGHQWIRVQEFSGAADVSASTSASGNTNADTVSMAASLTTNNNNSLVVAGIACRNRGATAPSFDWSQGTETGETERSDGNTDTGNAALAFSTADVGRATAGSQDMSADYSSTGNGGTNWNIAVVEVTEDAGGGPTLAVKDILGGGIIPFSR